MSDYANPTIEQVLVAVPMLQWRRCWECQHVGLYRDNMLPVCKCRECGSADTRQMARECRSLHAIEEELEVQDQTNGTDILGSPKDRGRN